MCSNSLSLLSSIYLLYLINNIKSAPSDYCLQSLNSSDCGGPPTPVFSYYKAGSRCEQEIWRGCLTLNKFDSESLCSHFCIFPFLRRPEDDSTTSWSRDTCRATLNQSKCTDQSIEVYTYDRYNRICSPAIWRGCNTGNLFTNEQNCLNTCNAGFTPGFKENLKLLRPKEAAKIDTILDAVIQDTTSSTRMYTKPVRTSTTSTSVSEVERNSSQEPATKEGSVEEVTTIRHDTSAAMTTSNAETTTLTTTPTTAAATTTTTTEPTTTVTPTTVETTTETYTSGTVEEVVLPYRREHNEENNNTMTK